MGQHQGRHQNGTLANQANLDGSRAYLGEYGDGKSHGLSLTKAHACGTGWQKPCACAAESLPSISDCHAD